MDEPAKIGSVKIGSGKLNSGRVGSIVVCFVILGIEKVMIIILLSLF